MALTLANAITEVRYQLNESSPAFWTDDEITAWIKEGTRIFSSKTLMVEGTDDLTLIANQLTYTSSDESWIANIIEPYALLYVDQSNNYKGIIKMHPRQIGNVATFAAGDPKYYMLHNRTLYIWPLTTAAIVSAGGTISVLYSKETDDITDITDEFQHLPILYATALAKRKDQKFAEATNIMQQFLNEVNFERKDKHSREVDSLESFDIPVGGGDVGARRSQ